MDHQILVKEEKDPKQRRNRIVRQIPVKKAKTKKTPKKLELKKSLLAVVRSTSSMLKSVIWHLQKSVSHLFAICVSNDVIHFVTTADILR